MMMLSRAHAHTLTYAQRMTRHAHLCAPFGSPILRSLDTFAES